MNKRKRGRPTVRKINRRRPVYMYADQTEVLTDAEFRTAADEYLKRKSANSETVQPTGL